MSGTGITYGALDTLSEDPGRVPAEPGRGSYAPFNDGRRASIAELAGGFTGPPYALDGEVYPLGDTVGGPLYAGA